MARVGRRVSISVFVALLWFSLSFGQAPDTLWTKTYGGPYDDIGYSVQETYDDGYIISGLTRSFGVGYDDVYLIKTDVDGNSQWTKTYGTIWDDAGYSVQETYDNGYIISGVKEYGPGDVWLIKTNSSGDTSWTKIYNDGSTEKGNSVKQTQDKGYIIVGYTWGSGAGGTDVWLIKTDSLGNSLWTKTFGGTENEVGECVQETSDGGYIIIGRTESFGAGGRDVYLVKTNSSGDSLWSKTYGGSDHDAGYEVQEVSGGYILVGGTWSFGHGENDVYLIKTDSLGNSLWTRYHGGSNRDLGYSVKETSDGGYIITGATKTYGSGDYDVYLIKTDSLGAIMWSEAYGGGSEDRGFSVQETSDGGYIIVGYTYSYGIGGFDVWLIKTEPDVSVEESKIATPKEQTLFLEVFPNPCSDKVTIMYGIEQRAEGLELKICDVSGRIVKQFSLPTPNSLLPTILIWDGSNNSGEKVQSGVYFLKYEVDEYRKIQKLLLLR